MTGLLYLATHSQEDPTRAAMPFHFANGAAEAGIEAAIVLAGDATILMKDIIANSLFPVGMPPLKDLFTKAVQNQVPIYV